MRLLLSSAGITNPSIRDALIELLGKPIAESNALCIPTGSYAQRRGAGGAWRFISGQEPRTPMVELGWKSVGVLELTALPSIDAALWVPLVKETDVLLVNGGDPLYLCYWMRQSGLADLLPSLSDTVYVGLSAGSMVMTPSIGEDFVHWRPPTGGDDTLGLVGFSIFPHLDHEDLPENTMADAERWAAGMPVPAYAIDDQTAIKVTDDTVEVISEGHWRSFVPIEQTLDDVVRSALLVGDIRSAAIFVPGSGSTALALAATAGVEGPALDGLVDAVQDPRHPVARALTDAGPTFDALPMAPGGPRLRTHVPLPAARADDRARLGVLAVAHDTPLDDRQRERLLDLAGAATTALVG